MSTNPALDGEFWTLYYVVSNDSKTVEAISKILYLCLKRRF
ncbi:hypothetical protein LEP1GSC051_3082 [Leptospira sp. P2653]|nr:hypothetical protein LEP1GSC051_3082 [Leptospira sp. P2653]